MLFKTEYLFLKRQTKEIKAEEKMDRHEVVSSKLCKHFRDEFRTSLLREGCGYNAVLDV